MTEMIYNSQFKEMLQRLYAVKAQFSEAFGGEMEAIDGVSSSETMFTLKRNADPVTLQDYDTDANTTFGTHEKWSRFGDMKEIKYTDVPVEYTFNYAAHEGLDKFTVNADLEQATADRLLKIAEAKLIKFNKDGSKALSDASTKQLTLASSDEAGLIKMMNEASSYMINNEVVGTLHAYVKPEIYNIAVNSSLTTTAKKSSVDIDTNTLPMLKGFVLHAVPEQYFDASVDAILVPEGAGRAFSGIEVARVVDGYQFVGNEIQVAGKGGHFIPEDNKKAIIKVTGLTVA